MSSLVLLDLPWYNLPQCALWEGDTQMNTLAAPQVTTLTMHSLLVKQKEVFREIPGMDILLRADPQEYDVIAKQYPDAAFALMISNNLFLGDREQNEIHQKAYLAILKGESISSVCFRYDYDLEAYLHRHMWD